MSNCNGPMASFLLMSLAMVFGMHSGSCAGQINLDYLASFTFDVASQRQMLVLTDAETLTSRKFPLPAGYLAGNVVCMDAAGDVWCSEVSFQSPAPPTNTLLHVSARDGTVLGSYVTSREPTHMAPLPNGDVLVGSCDPGLALGNSVYLTQLTPAGAVVRDLDLAALFPPGEFMSFARAIGMSGEQWAPDGVRRVLVHEDGAIWIQIANSVRQGLVILEPDWTLRAALPVLLPRTIFPLVGGDVVMGHRDGPPRFRYPSASFLPTIVPRGYPGPMWDGGLLIRSDGSIGLSMMAPLYALSTPSYDARGSSSDDLYFMVSSARTASQIWTGTRQWALSQPTVPMPGGAPPTALWASTAILDSGLERAYSVHLDGRERPWLLVVSIANRSTYRNLAWIRFDRDAGGGVTSELVEVGTHVAPRPAPLLPVPSEVCTFGHASLHEFVCFTDPFGDIDGDGVPNRTELNNGRNPLRTLEFSDRVTVTMGPDRRGLEFEFLWSHPGDFGRLYVAPLAVQPRFTYAPSGQILPFDPNDPLVGLSLTLGSPVFSGMVGQLDAFGQARSAIDLSVLAPLSGQTFQTALLTFEDQAATRLRSVSPPFPFVIP